MVSGNFAAIGIANRISWARSYCAAARLRHRCARLGVDSVVIACKHGPRLELSVSSDLLPRLLGGAYEREHIAVLRSLLRAGDGAIDVGANVGIIAAELAMGVGKSGTVLAFEPEPHTYRALVANMARNDYSQVHSFNLALSESAGTATLELPVGRAEYGSLAPVVHDSAKGSSRCVSTVTVESLDRVASPLLPACRLMKLDTEGHELSVLRGATHFIAARRPYISIEVVPALLASHGSSEAGVLRWFDGAGYRLRDLAGTSLKPERLGQRGYHQFIAEPN